MDLDRILEIITVWLPQVVTIASIVVALTPTPKDNAIIDGIYKVIEVLALNIGKAKE